MLGFLIGAGMAGVTGFFVGILHERDRRRTRVVVLMRGRYD